MLDKFTAPALVRTAPGGQFHAMAKPAGSTCNLDCKYCFLPEQGALPGGPGTGEMSDETLELFIRQYIEGVTGPEVVFSWQGGEPTLRGSTSSAGSSRCRRNTPSPASASRTTCRPTACCSTKIGRRS